MRDSEWVEFYISRLFCINICPRFDLHSRDSTGVYLLLHHRWCVCVLRSPCWVLQSVGSGLGRRLNVVAALMPILRTHNKRHPSREPATECNRVGSTVSLECLLAGHAGQPREGQEHVDHDEGQVEGGEQGGGGGQVEP